MFAVFSIVAACLFSSPLTSAFQHCCFQLLRLPVREKLTISTSINSTEIFYWVLKWTPASALMALPDPLTPQSPRPFEFSIKWMPQRLWNHVQSHKLASLMLPAAFPSIFNRLTGASKHLPRQPWLWKQTLTHKQSCCPVHMHIHTANLSLLFSPYLPSSAYFRCPFAEPGLSHHCLPCATVSRLVNLRTHQRMFEKCVMAPFAALCKLLKKLC